mgnify:CR=1 FL=1
MNKMFKKIAIVVAVVLLLATIALASFTLGRSNQDKLGTREKSSSKTLSHKKIHKKKTQISASVSSPSLSASSSVAVSSNENDFDGLPQDTQLALLVITMFDGRPFMGTHYAVYMGTPSVIVIDDYGEGIGDWMDHSVRILDNHNGTFNFYQPVSSTDNADANASNTQWKYYKTVNAQDLVSNYDQTAQDRDLLQQVINMLDLRTRNRVFSYLPN